MIRERLGGRAFAMLTLLTALLVATTAPAAAAGQTLNWDADTAPQAQTEVDVTKAVHDMAWGQSAEAVRTYEGDDGSLTEVEAEVNTSAQNPYTFHYTEVNHTDYGAFPHDKADTSAIDAGEWTKDMSGSAGTGTVENVETAPGVEGVRISTSSQSSGDAATFTFSNFSVTSDEDKRFAQAVYNANSADSGVTYELRYVDSDGDYKTVVSNSTAVDGVVTQEQLGNIATEGSGDGTFDDIQQLQIVVSDADASLTFVGLNAEKMSPYDLGDQQKDTDGDDTLESVDVGEDYAGGAVSLAGLDTLGSSFSDARIHDLTAPMEFTGELAGSEDVMVERTEDESVESGNYPGYKGTATVYVRLSLPDAYDLAFSGAALTDTQSVNSDRLISVEYAEGVSDTEFGNISDSSWTDVTGSYSGEGSSVTVDDTIQVGQTSVLKYTYKLTPDQFDNIVAQGGSGGSGAMGGLGNNIPLVGGIIATLAAFLKRLS